MQTSKLGLSIYTIVKQIFEDIMQNNKNSTVNTIVFLTVLANEKFYLLNIQTLCKTDDGDYLPCEIGAIEYSIKSGITKTLHRFIEPGKY